MQRILEDSDTVAVQMKHGLRLLATFGLHNLHVIFFYVFAKDLFCFDSIATMEAWNWIFGMLMCLNGL